MKKKKKKKKQEKCDTQRGISNYRRTEIMAAPGMIEKGNRTCTEKPAKGKKQR